MLQEFDVPVKQIHRLLWKKVNEIIDDEKGASDAKKQGSRSIFVDVYLLGLGAEPCRHVHITGSSHEIPASPTRCIQRYCQRGWKDSLGFRRTYGGCGVWGCAEMSSLRFSKAPFLIMKRRVYAICPGL